MFAKWTVAKAQVDAGLEDIYASSRLLALGQNVVSR